MLRLAVRAGRSAGRLSFVFVGFAVFLLSLNLISLRLEALFLERRIWSLIEERERLRREELTLRAQLEALRCFARIEEKAKLELKMVRSSPKGVVSVERRGSGEAGAMASRGGLEILGGRRAEAKD